MNFEPQPPPVALMRALICTAPGALTLSQVPIPGPAKDEVLVRLVACGVCHTDYHILSGEFPGNPLIQNTPIVIGHEGVGEVVLLGSDVRDSEIGARVGVPWLHSSCSRCDFCLSGNENICESQTRTGFSSQGCLSEYVCAKADHLVAIPDSLNIYEAAPLMCAGLTSYKAIKEGNCKAGDYIALIGASGGLGHIAIQYAKAMGLIVFAVTHGAEKMKFCQSLGADASFDLNDPSVLNSITSQTPGGSGLHAVINFSPATESTNLCCKLLRPKGTFVQVGLAPGNFQIDIFNVVMKALTIKGSIVGTREDMIEALAFAGRGLVKPVVSIQNIEDVVQVFHEMEKGNLQGRVVFKLGDPTLPSDYMPYSM